MKTTLIIVGCTLEITSDFHSEYGLVVKVFGVLLVVAAVLLDKSVINSRKRG